MNDKKYFLSEIEKSLKISKMFKSGYSNYGDRSEYLIKLIKKLDTSEEMKEFKEALKEFLIPGKKDRIDFIVDVLIDGVEFGSLI